MRILPAVEAEFRRAIRDERARDPLISVMRLKEKLEEKFSRGFSHQYVSKIADKVAREAIVELDRTQIEQRMSFTRENYRMMREELLKVVYWKDGDGGSRPRAQDRVEAAKSTVMLDLALLKAEIETGMYKKPVEALVKEIRYDPLQPELRAVVIRSWRNFGLLPEAAIQAMVPAQLKPQ